MEVWVDPFGRASQYGIWCEGRALPSLDQAQMPLDSFVLRFQQVSDIKPKPYNYFVFFSTIASLLVLRFTVPIFGCM